MITNFNAMRIQRVNIGEIIKNRVGNEKGALTKFAQGVGLKKQNVKKTVFEKHSIDTDLLCRISEYLGINFFELYRESNKKDYLREVKARVTIEVENEKKEQVFLFDLSNT
jgi:plasmid maintenance system antidote protein VapI